jgi:hypothetical protein
MWHVCNMLLQEVDSIGRAHDNMAIGAIVSGDLSVEAFALRLHGPKDILHHYTICLQE